MDRKEFLSLLGVGTAAIVCSYCLPGCTVNDPGITAPTNVDFTLDLTNAAYSALKTVGGSFANNGVLVANTPGGYVAVSIACTHQVASVGYDKANNNFYCPAHGSVFATNGSVVRGPAGSPLATYKITLTGSSLRVYS
jgi:cytochrome b6-f complex iron-sulfur subunit